MTYTRSQEYAYCNWCAQVVWVEQGRLVVHYYPTDNYASLPHCKGSGQPVERSAIVKGRTL